MVRELKKIVVLAIALMLSTSLLIMSAGSDIIVPYEWIVPGAHARYRGLGSVDLFFPNHTSFSMLKHDESFIEWTVVNRTDDVVQLNLTFYAEGSGFLAWKESVPDGKVDMKDVGLAAKSFARKPYEWDFDLNPDITGPEGTPDQKVDMRDVSLVARAFGSYPGDENWNPLADIAPEEHKTKTKHVVHHKNLLLEIDIYSRETFLDSKPLGKTCFWAEPYADIGDKLVLYGLSPEEINGTVEDFKDMSNLGWAGVTAYFVFAIQLDPYSYFAMLFDWDTGMVMEICLQGSQPIDPTNPHRVGFPNGTEYYIYRYAATPIATELNIGYLECHFVLESTNVQIGPPL